MTGFDIIVLAIVGVAAIGGLLRGFVQEVLSLAAWALAIVAIYFFHADLSAVLLGHLSSPSGAAVLAFVILLLVPYAVLRAIALRAGRSSRKSVLGAVDRVLGFGFGAVKGVVVVVMLFSLVVLGYDTVWGEEGRPEWIRSARTYAFVNASSKAMVQLIDERDDYWLGTDTADAAGEGETADGAAGEATP
jgi:membrane protein required for colicin V production